MFLRLRSIHGVVREEGDPTAGVSDNHRVPDAEEGDILSFLSLIDPSRPGTDIVVGRVAGRVGWGQLLILS
jgi:hypothetical protein